MTTKTEKSINYEQKYTELLEKYNTCQEKKRNCRNKYLQSEKGKQAKSRANKKYYEKRKLKISTNNNKDNAVSS